MKKTHKLYLLFTLIGTSILTGCFNSVFYEIRKDVAPEPKTLNSPINQITRFTVGTDEYLVLAADKGIRYKKADSTTHDEWKVFSDIPFELHHYDYDSEEHLGEHIIGVYSDSTNLYIMTNKYDINKDLGVTYPVKIILHTLDGTTLTSADNTWKGTPAWNEIDDEALFPFYSDNNKYYSAFSLIQTNAISNGNREVYLRTGTPAAKDDAYKTVTYYKLAGASTPVDVTAAVNTNLVDGTDENSCVRSAVNVNGTTYFFNAWAATTNDSETKFYYSSGTTVKSGTGVNKDTDNKDLNESHVNVGKKISALAFCKDILLIGCADFEASSTSYSNGGIYKTSMTADVPGTSLVDFTTNAKFQINSSYYVTTLLNATPDKTELESSLYCGTQVYGTDTSSNASFDNIGLWSYYPNRGNWNRE